MIFLQILIVLLLSLLIVRNIGLEKRVENLERKVRKLAMHPESEHDLEVEDLYFKAVESLCKYHEKGEKTSDIQGE